MNETDQLKPFYRRREFQGTLSQAGKNIDDLHFIIDYAENKPEKIKAAILGDTTDFRISDLMRRGGAPYAEIRSKAYEGCYEIIRSSRAIIKQAYNKGWPNEYGDHMVGKICDIELQELKIDISVDNKDRDERGICFYLAGPRGLVDSLLNEQSVEWKDLYPTDVVRPSFFNTRNALVHSANEIDGELLFYETYRVQTIVERLLLKLLGWKNIYRAGSFHTDSLAKGPGGN